MSLRDQVFGSRFRVEPVSCPNWGTVYVRELTGKGATATAEAIRDKDNLSALVTVAIHCCCDAEGNLLFTEADREALSEKQAGDLKAVFEAGLKVNGMLKEDAEETEKN